MNDSSNNIFASYSGNTTSGTLTLTEGTGPSATVIASLELLGNYSNAFSSGSDSGVLGNSPTGTLVEYTPTLATSYQNGGYTQPVHA